MTFSIVILAFLSKPLHSHEELNRISALIHLISLYYVILIPKFIFYQLEIQLILSKILLVSFSYSIVNVFQLILLKYILQKKGFKKYFLLIAEFHVFFYYLDLYKWSQLQSMH